ncbi:MAG: 30S ribosomal protein S11 [Candidatus Pacebacteria bacterium]|nr:30S ribosomal protein S11 [Candidatus Paceibacterota bacterium]
MGKRRIITIGSKEKGSSKTLKVGASKKIKRKNIVKGQVHIKSTYNNTIVTLTDLNGNVIAWSSAGLLGFKGAKKATPYAATTIIGSLLEKTKKIGLKEVEVYVKGIGSGRESAVRAIAANGINIISITDTTPIPHNGCRPPKPRRV